MIEVGEVIAQILSPRHTHAGKHSRSIPSSTTQVRYQFFVKDVSTSRLIALKVKSRLELN